MANFEAYGYIRCSGLGQMDKDGPQRQRRAIEEYCSTRSFTIVGWFQEGYTGSDLEGRAEFQRMRALLVELGNGIVVCEKLDRIARDVMIQESIIADFRKNCITLISSTPGEEDLCSKDPTRVLIRQIMGAFAEYERKMIIHKLNAGRARMRAQGRREGRKPYGTQPGEQDTLNLMLSLSGRFDHTRIAAILNENNIQTRYGSKWNSGTVYKILRRHFQQEQTSKLER